MAVTSWRTGGTVSGNTTLSGYPSDVTWTGTGNIAASDNVYATAALTTGQYAYILRSSNFGFGAEIPSGATIDGIEVEIEAKANASSAIVSGLFLCVDSVAIQSNSYEPTPGGHLPTSDTVFTFGGATDDMGAVNSNEDPVTDVEVTGSSFGVMFFGAAAASATISVDRIRMRVFYTPNSVSLVPNDATMASSADQATLVNIPRLFPADGGHAHAADTSALTFKAPLIVNDAAHASLGDQASLIGRYSLAVSDGIHSHFADEAFVGLRLYINDGTHAHAGDQLQLLVSFELAIADSGHVQTAEAVELVISYALDIAAGLHAHSATPTSIILIAVTPSGRTLRFLFSRSAGRTVRFGESRGDGRTLRL